MEENKNIEYIIKYHQKKRKKHKIKLAKISISLAIFGLILIAIYGFANKEHIIKYKENSNVNYGVNLIENEFYEKTYIDEGIDIISTLIKDINVQFSYNLDLEEEREYEYSYKIIAETDVKEKSKTNSIYETEEEILNKAQQEGKSKKLVILETVNLDYNKYNDQITKLITYYKLSNTTSKLDVSLYLNVIDKETGEQINKENKVMSVEIPLVTKTVEMTVNEKVKNKQGEIIRHEIQIENSEYILFVGILALIAGLITLGILIKYILDTRSAEKMYDDELKKILFDYKSYIQKVNNKINYDDYKIIKIDTFIELIEMREEIQSPILMYTDEENKTTTFIMINGDLLFENTLGASLIREKLIKKSKEKKEKRGNIHEKNK